MTTTGTSADAGANWTLVKLSTDSIAGLKKAFPVSPPDLDVALYFSPDEVTKTLTDAQTIVTKQGYSCTALPGSSNAGFACTTSGQPDLVYAAGPLDANFITNVTGLSDADRTTLKSAIGTNKSAIELLSGTGIAKGVMDAMNGGGSGSTTPTTTPSSSTTTPAATTTTGIGPDNNR